MDQNKIKELLYQEMENKKTYPANYDTSCDFCGGDINEGEDIVFMGHKQKVCTNCQAEIMEFLEI